MASQIGSIIELSTRKENDVVDIHTYPAHERTQGHMGKTNARFFMTMGTPGVKGDWRKDYNIMPDNHILLPSAENPLHTLPPWCNPLISISHTKFGQFETSQQLSQMMGWKHVHYEHTWPRKEWDQAALDHFKQMRADYNVFISSQSAEAWGWSLEDSSVAILHHAVDVDFFKPRWNTKKTCIIACNNDWINRGSILGFDLFQEIVIKNNLPNLIIGDTPGLSKAAQNVYDLVNKYNQGNIFVNFARESPLPTVLIENMACGNVPVSLDVCMCSELIEDGVNGFKSNDNKVLLDHLRRLVNSPEECRILGERARQTIIDNFPLQKFINSWNNIFKKCLEIQK